MFQWITEVCFDSVRNGLFEFGRVEGVFTRLKVLCKVSERGGW